MKPMKDRHPTIAQRTGLTLLQVSQLVTEVPRRIGDPQVSRYAAHIRREIQEIVTDTAKETTEDQPGDRPRLWWMISLATVGVLYSAYAMTWWLCWLIGQHPLGLGA